MTLKELGIGQKGIILSEEAEHSDNIFWIWD